MLYLGTFFNNVVNQLIRNLDMNVRIIISIVFICLATFCIYKLIKSINKDLDLKKSKMKYGWLVLALIFATLSILYIIL